MTPPHRQQYVVNDQVNAYQRLVDLAQLFTDDVRRACQAVGVGRGATVADVGCGPLGALDVLAQVVGPSGQVIGIDVDADALARAHQILDGQGLSNVRLICANLLTSVPREHMSGQQCDLAYSRLVLIHQPDPVAALRQIASLVRPGGYVVVHDWVMSSFPEFTPSIPAVSRYVSSCQKLMRARGASPDVPKHLSEVCRRAGLIEISQRGFVHMGPGMHGRTWPGSPIRLLRLRRD